MKILFLTSSLGAGGAERVATTLCNAWATRGDKVTLIPTFSGGGQSFYNLVAAVELVYLANIVGIKRKTIGSYAKRFFALRRIIRDRQPDVIVSFLPNVNVAAIFTSAFLKIPLIICERRDPSSQHFSNFLEFSCRATYRFADMLTVQTEAVVNKVVQIYPRLKLVREISNPLPDGVVAVRKSRPCHERKTLLSIGRLSPEKQIDLIISVFAECASRYQDWDLHVYGDGPLRADLEMQIHNLGMQERIILQGHTTEPWKIMVDADAFVMASKCEGFPNTLLEAMGVGLPCVAFDCPSGPREISSRGKYATLVKLDDKSGLLAALEKIMSDKIFASELGEQARASILERYRLSEIINRWDQLFREVGAII